jgi:hypothetical protein
VCKIGYRRIDGVKTDDNPVLISSPWIDGGEHDCIIDRFSIPFVSGSEDEAKNRYSWIIPAGLVNKLLVKSRIWDASLMIIDLGLRTRVVHIDPSGH